MDDTEISIWVDPEALKQKQRQKTALLRQALERLSKHANQATKLS